MFDKKVYDIYSSKHRVSGQIYDYGVLVKLVFEYDNFIREIALARSFSSNNEEVFKELGEKMLDSCIDNLVLKGQKRRPMLHYWYLEERKSRETERLEVVAHGMLTGHPKMPDSIEVRTTAVDKVVINEETKEAEIHAKDAVYYCPLPYCNFEKQAQMPSLMPDYEALRNRYQEMRERPTIEPGKVLLVLSNFDEYYFHSLYYVKEGMFEETEYSAYPNVGSYQDSFSIEADEEPISIEYFPHFQNIVLYQQYTAGKPMFIENIGDAVLYVKADCGALRLEPGERKEVIEENAEAEPPVLPNGDLYTAGIIE